MERMINLVHNFCRTEKLVRITGGDTQQLQRYVCSCMFTADLLIREGLYAFPGCSPIAGRRIRKAGFESELRNS